MRQLTLRRFEGVSGLRVALTRAGWRALQEELEQEFPHLKVDWDGLSGKLAEMVGREATREEDHPSRSSREATARGEKRREQAIDPAEAGSQVLRRTVGRLRRLLLESNPGSLRLAGRELNELGELIGQVAPGGPWPGSGTLRSWPERVCSGADKEAPRKPEATIRSSPGRGG